MADITKRQSDGSQWPSGFNFYGETFISGTTVAPFVNKRGDVISGSHVVSSSLRMGNAVNGNTGGCGTFQVAAGVYQDIFPSRWPDHGFKYVSHVLVPTNLTTAAQLSNYHVQEVGQLTTGSSPFKALATVFTSSLVQYQILSGTSTVPVDPPVDFGIFTVIFADNSDGNY